MNQRTPFKSRKQNHKLTLSKKKSDTHKKYKTKSIYDDFKIIGGFDYSLI